MKDIELLQSKFRDELHLSVRWVFITLNWTRLPTWWTD